MRYIGNLLPVDRGVHSRSYLKIWMQLCGVGVGPSSVVLEWNIIKHIFKAHWNAQNIYTPAMEDLQLRHVQHTEQLRRTLSALWVGSLADNLRRPEHFKMLGITCARNLDVRQIFQRPRQLLIVHRKRRIVTLNFHGDSGPMHWVRRWKFWTRSMPWKFHIASLPNKPRPHPYFAVVQWRTQPYGQSRWIDASGDPRWFEYPSLKADDLHLPSLWLRSKSQWLN